MHNSTYTLWSLWPALSYLNRLFALILAVVFVYSTTSAIIVYKGLRRLIRSRESAARNSFQFIATLHRRCANLRQILGATFFLFGLLFFLGLPSATITIGDGRGILAFEILSNFVTRFIYAANVFLIFFGIHLVQWVTSSRVYAYELRLERLRQT
jgi:hypothetical protein